MEGYFGGKKMIAIHASIAAVFATLVAFFIGGFGFLELVAIFYSVATLVLALLAVRLYFFIGPDSH